MDVNKIREAITEAGGDVAHLSDEQLEEHAKRFTANVTRCIAFAVHAWAAFLQQGLEVGLFDEEKETLP